MFNGFTYCLIAKNSKKCYFITRVFARFKVGLKGGLLHIGKYIILCLMLFLLSGCGVGGGGDNGGSSDTVAPYAPYNLTATVLGESSIYLTWSASYDNYSVAGYRIYRDNAEIADIPGIYYTDTGLNGDTAYCYSARAYDGAGNLSDASTSSCATTNSAISNVGTAITILASPILERSGGVAFDGANFLSSIQGDSVSSSNASAQILSPGGTLSGPLISTGIDGSAPVAAFDGTNYLIVWVRPDASGRALYGQFVTPAGALYGSAFEIDAGPLGGTGISGIAYGAGTYLAAYCKDVTVASGGDTIIYGRTISTSGATGAEFRISSGYGDYAGPQAVAFDGANFLVAWVDDDNDMDIKARFVSPSGSAGSEFTVSAGSYNAASPLSLAFDGANYLIVWSGNIDADNWQLKAALADTAGNLSVGEFSISSNTGHAYMPLVSFDGTYYLVLWTERKKDVNNDGICDSTEESCWNVQAVNVTTSGANYGSVFKVSNADGNQWATGLTYGGGGHLAAWTSGDGIAGATGDAYAAFIEAQQEGALTGMWSATLDGTVYHDENETGQSTTLAMTITQIGSYITGSITFTDTLSRSGSSGITGTINGDYVVLQSTDFDSTCSERAVTWTGTITATTMALYPAAPAGGACDEFYVGSPEDFTRQ